MRGLIIVSILLLASCQPGEYPVKVYKGSDFDNIPYVPSRGKSVTCTKISETQVKCE